MPTFSAPLPDEAKPGDQGVSGDINAIVAALKEIREVLGPDMVTRSDLTDLSASVQEYLESVPGMVVADDAGAFTADLPATKYKIWEGRDSSDYSRASVRDVRFRGADADWA